MHPNCGEASPRANSLGSLNALFPGNITIHAGGRNADLDLDPIQERQMSGKRPSSALTSRTAQATAGSARSSMFAAGDLHILWYVLMPT